MRVPLIALDGTELLVADVAAWGTISLTAGYVGHRLADRRLDHDGVLTRLRPWEAEGRVYERRFRITAWKDRMPEAGDIFEGGYSKRSIRRADLGRYLLETRRAELTHWWIMLAAPVFFLWNPWPVGILMAVYAVVANLPCLVIQRYNRARLLRILGRRRR